MIHLPKPRGFRDYALFAVFMAGLLLFLFWLTAAYPIGWADAVLALAEAALMALCVKSVPLNPVGGAQGGAAAGGAAFVGQIARCVAAYTQSHP